MRFALPLASLVTYSIFIRDNLRRSEFINRSGQTPRINVVGIDITTSQRKEEWEVKEGRKEQQANDGGVPVYWGLR